MPRLFLAALAVSVAGSFAAAQPPKPKDPPPTGESQAILEELGLTAVPGLPVKLPEEYRPDLITEGDVRQNPKRYAVRAAVLDAAAALRKSRELRMTDTFPESEYNPKGKVRVTIRQKEVAKVEAALRAALDGLEAAADRRGGEPSKRWLAHYEYARALVKQRLARVNEYNQMLDHILRDKLPELDRAAGQNGWRLVQADTMASASDVRQLAADARKELAAVAKAHPKTTWAVLAERDLETKPGLRWEPMVIEQSKKEKKK
jgi:hypothetical protein